MSHNDAYILGWKAYCYHIPRDPTGDWVFIYESSAANSKRLDVLKACWMDGFDTASVVAKVKENEK